MSGYYYFNLGEQEKFSFQYGEEVELEIRNEWKP